METKRGSTKVAGKLLATLAPRQAVVFLTARKFLRVIPVYCSGSRARGDRHSLLRVAATALASEFQRSKAYSSLLDMPRLFRSFFVK